MRKKGINGATLSFMGITVDDGSKVGSEFATAGRSEEKVSSQALLMLPQVANGTQSSRKRPLVLFLPTILFQKYMPMMRQRK
jgi:hypothetical protein